MGVTHDAGDEPATDGDNAVEQSVVDDLIDRMDRLEDRQARVERENDDLREQVDELEQENDNLRRELSEAKGLVNSLRERVDGSLGDDLRDRVESLASDVDTVQQGLANVTGQLNRLKKRLVDGDLATEAEESAQSADHGVTPSTPLENVVALPDHSADDHLSANQARARWVASKAVELSDKSQAGRTINAGRIRRALSSADRDSRPATVRRVFAFLNELGESGTTVKKQNGRRLVVFHGDTAERLSALADNSVVNR
jgi:chaperonin cofactor prefoldin